MRVVTIPGTDFMLPNTWRIYVSNGVAESPPSQAADTLYGMRWMGNIVVAKYGRRDPTHFINVPHLEVDFANLLVGVLVEVVWVVEKY